MGNAAYRGAKPKMNPSIAIAEAGCRSAVSRVREGTAALARRIGNGYAGQIEREIARGGAIRLIFSSRLTRVTR